MADIIQAQPLEGGGGDVELGGGLTSSLLDPIEVTLVEKDLTAMSGVVIRQEVITTEVMAQALGVPYEAKNKYKISALPGGVSVPASQSDAAGWNPTNEELEALPTLLYAHEQSDCMTRCLAMMGGCAGGRGMKMSFFEEDRKTERFSFTRKFKFGIKMVVPIFMGIGVFVGRVLEMFLASAGYCTAERKNEMLCVLSSSVYGVCVLLGIICGLVLLVFKTEEIRLRLDVGAFKSTTVHGMIEERFEPYEGAYSTSAKVWDCCCGIVYSRLLQRAAPSTQGDDEKEVESLAKGLTSDQWGELQHAFTTRTAQCCFPACSCCCLGASGHNNCYGATCCRDRLIIDILDRQGQVVAHAAKVYAPGGGANCVKGACCRMLSGYSNYLLEFPPGATQRERALLLASFIATDLELFDNNQ